MMILADLAAQKRGMVQQVLRDLHDATDGHATFLVAIEEDIPRRLPSACASGGGSPPPAMAHAHCNRASLRGYEPGVLSRRLAARRNALQRSIRV